MVVGPVMLNEVDVGGAAVNIVAFVNTDENIKIYQVRDNLTYNTLKYTTHISDGDHIFFSGFYFTDQ